MNTSGKDEHGTLLHTLQSQLMDKGRENLNFKMEIAHLRERLSSFIGTSGDVKAFELEANNFQLKKSLMNLEQEHKTIVGEKNQMEQKCGRAMKNMVKLDKAWRVSLDENEALKKTLVSTQEQHQAIESASLQMRETLNETTARLRTANASVVTVQQENQHLAQENQHVQNQLTELQSQVDRMTQSRQDVHASSRHTEMEYKSKFQASVEQEAKLRGQVIGLQSECQCLQNHFDILQAEAAQDQAKVLLLTEEKSTLTIHLNAAKGSVDGIRQDLAHARSEIERLQGTMSSLEQQLLEEQSRVEVKLERIQALENEVKLAGLASQDLLVKERQRMTQSQAQDETRWNAKLEVTESEMQRLKNRIEALEQGMERTATSLSLSIVMDKDNQDSSFISEAWIDQVLIRDTIQPLVVKAAQVQARDRVIETSKEKLQVLMEENTKLKTDYERAKGVLHRMSSRKTNKLQDTTNSNRRVVGKENTGSSSTGIGASVRGGNVKRTTTSASSSSTIGQPSIAKAKTIQVKSRYLQ